MKYLPFLIFSLFASSNIELYMDWQCDAKKDELFAFDPSVSDSALTLPQRIRKELLKKDIEIQSWDRNAFRPWLLKLSKLKSFDDFKSWLGFGLPKLSSKMESTKYWVFWNLGPHLFHYDFQKAPKEKMVLFLFEPPVVQPEIYDPKIQENFSKIFTWDDDLVDGKKFFKFFYPVLKEPIEDAPSFRDKKLCTLINSRLSSKHPKELYSEREKVIRFFEDKPDEFDLFGRFWAKRKYRNYKGEIGNKIETLKNYRFSICYENTKDVKGYITEKIFDCFQAKVVPIYLGASNVQDFIPKECFIDRREFGSDEELYCFIKEMPEERYNTYLIEAKKFIQSKESKLFSDNYFVINFLKTLSL